MTVRPPTLRVLHGVELFACERIPADLSRAACARRHAQAATIRLTAAKRERTAASLDAQTLGVCVGCPVGALHRKEVGTELRAPRALRASQFSSPARARRAAS